MERDRRLTGFQRGQTDKPVAPPGFELNNPWRVRHPCLKSIAGANKQIVRESIPLSAGNESNVQISLQYYTNSIRPIQFPTNSHLLESQMEVYEWPLVQSPQTLFQNVSQALPSSLLQS